MEQANTTGQLAERIKQLRRQRGWSAEQLARECSRIGPGKPSLTRSTIAKIESGARKSVTTDELAVLARVLDVTPTALLASTVVAETVRSKPEQLPARPAELAARRLGGGLPGDVTHFTGRAETLEELRARVAEHGSLGTVVAIHAIDGMAGVGKTAFARHAARQLAHRFQDGAIWVDLYGHTPGLQRREPSDALEQMLLQLGVPREAIAPDLAERQDQWRWHMRERSMLIVLDDALTTDQVMPLLPDAPRSLVLITSRRKLTGLTDAHPLSLGVLDEYEATQLFVELVGKERCADGDAVSRILAACGRLPLAIRLIAGRLRHHPGEVLTHVAFDLEDRNSTLDELETDHFSVRAALELSYRALTDEQQQVFRRISWHPGPEINLQVITAIADVPPARGKRLLRDLFEHSLLDQLPAEDTPGGPRYRVHDLVRLYALERADAVEFPTARAVAVKRLTSSYLATVRLADELLRPNAVSESVQRIAPSIPPQLGNASQTRTWLGDERQNLVCCIRSATQTTMPAELSQVAELSAIVAVHLRDLGFWSDARECYTHRLDVARTLGDLRSQADALRGVGEIASWTADYDEAYNSYTQALDLAKRLADRRSEADALRGLGEVKRLTGSYREAHTYHTAALDLAKPQGDRRSEVWANWGLGNIARLTGLYSDANDCYGRSLELAKPLGDRRGEVLALWGLGEIALLIGDFGRARDYYTQALQIARPLRDRLGEVVALRGLGHIARHDEMYEKSRELYTESLDIARSINDRRGEVEALRGLGHIDRLTDKFVQAGELYSKALELARRVHDRRDEADALWGLGEVAHRIRDFEHAHEYFTQSLDLAKQLGYRLGKAKALHGLGNVADALQEPSHQYLCDAFKIYQELGAPAPDNLAAAIHERGCSDD